MPLKPDAGPLLRTGNFSAACRCNVVTRYLHLPRVRMSNKGFFKWRQIIVPLLPVPLGCWFLYKALVSFNRNPPPIATDSATVLARPLYAEPVYQVRARLY